MCPRVWAIRLRRREREKKGEENKWDDTEKKTKYSKKTKTKFKISKLQNFETILPGNPVWCPIGAESRLKEASGPRQYLIPPETNPKEENKTTTYYYCIKY